MERFETKRILVCLGYRKKRKVQRRMAYDLVKVHCEKRFKSSGDLVERMKSGEDKGRVLFAD